LFKYLFPCESKYVLRETMKESITSMLKLKP
jgi:hypothetical protein